MILEFRKQYLKANEIINEINDDDDHLLIMEKFQRIFNGLVLKTTEILVHLDVSIRHANTDNFIQGLELLRFGMLSLSYKFEFMLVQCNITLQFAYRYL